MSARLRVVGKELRDFSLPLRRPIHTARGPIAARELIILRLVDERGAQGLGEAAPLPGFSAETLAEVRSELLALDPTRWSGLQRPEDVAEILDAQPLSPASRHALDQALLGLLATRRGRSIGALLHPGARRSIPIHALIDDPSELEGLDFGARPGTLREEPSDRATAGGLDPAVTGALRAVKLKIGARDLESDVARATQIRQRLPAEVAIRLDANGAYTPQAAVDALLRFQGLGVVAVEQPVAPGDPEAMAWVRRRAGLSILVDEGVRGLADLEAHIREEACDGVVLKPMLLGGILRARSLAQRAAEAGLGISVTTSFESAIGRRAAAELAAAVPGTLLTSGLETGRFLRRDLDEDLVARERELPRPNLCGHLERHEPRTECRLEPLFGRAG
ncbi:MAG: enolase C-terminal domain-like protein [Myxococcota bacterium]